MFGEWFSVVRLRLLALMHRRRLDRDLEEELRFHLAAREDRYRQAGMEPGAAARDARRDFGNPTAWKETCRDMWTFYWVETLRQDLRYAARSLRKSPGFTLVAVLTLALGIGSTTAIFTLVNAAILRSLPYADPARLVELWGTVQRAHMERRGASLPDYADWRDQSRSFEAMSWFDKANFTLTGGDEPEMVGGEYVAYPYFAMLGVRPALGRTFRPDEDEVPQRDRVVVLSDGLWKRRFGGDSAILGRTIRIDRQSFTVLGVMPAWFHGITDSAELWQPVHMSASAEDFAHRGLRGTGVLGKLKPGVSITQAQAEMDGICKRIEAAYPSTNRNRGVELSPLARELVDKDVRLSLLVALVAVGFVLMIACTNVANLMLARAEARQREIAVRMALGAGRGRVLRQLTTESLLLASTGAGAGLLLAHWGLAALIAANVITPPSYIRPSLDPRVTLFAILVTCTVGLALGIAPAIHVRSATLGDRFKQAGSHAADSRGGSRFRSTLVVAEVALAMLLLVGAGLLMRSLRQLGSVHPGYDPRQVLALSVSLPPAVGDARAAVSAHEILRRVAEAPGVESAAIGSDVPLTGWSAIFYTAGGQPEIAGQNTPRAYTHMVSPGFFRALRIPLVAGRTFAENETRDSNVAIVSENVVKRFWSGQDPIGKRIRSGGPNSDSPWWRIVGVVAETKYRGLPNNPTADPDIFLPISDARRDFAVLARTRDDPAALVPAVRAIIHEADPAAVVYNVSTMTELVARYTAISRITGWMMTVFAAAALLLASIGIYGVMAYSVSRRTQEIGIRVALGAARGDVLRMVVSRGMRLILVGLAIGAAAAPALTRLIGSLLFGVRPTDLLSFAAAALALTLVAVIACLAPATRASRIAPAVALRNE